MQLKYIYEHDIERDINGVIKVAQNDEESIKQELGEYIITRELRKHFNTFFNNYERSLSYPTDKIGVWISGFSEAVNHTFLKYCPIFFPTIPWPERRRWTIFPTSLTIR